MSENSRVKAVVIRIVNSWQNCAQHFLKRRSHLNRAVPVFEAEHKYRGKLMAEKETRARQKAEELQRKKIEAAVQAQRIEEERRTRELIEEARAKQMVAVELKLRRQLNYRFNNDFLQAFSFYQSQCSEHITPDEFAKKRSRFVQSWVRKNLESELTVPDDEQAAAIGTVEGHVQVVARAGSGKTTTLVQRAVFLQKHCGIAPDEMLLLAFNKEAAGEMRGRLQKHLGADAPNALTFHSLAYGIVNPSEEVIKEVQRYRLVQDIVEAYLENAEHQRQLRSLLMAHFREDWERVFNKSEVVKDKAFERFRRSLSYQGFDGRTYKSRGEKLIADFLFEHNVAFKYEKVFPFGYKRSYRPDFTLEDHQLVIEYFGLVGKEDYDEQTEKKKEYWQSRNTHELLSYYPHHAKDAHAFAQRLKQDLEARGVNCTKLSEDELWERIEEEQKPVAKFTRLVDGFISRCYKQYLTPQALAKRVSLHKSSSSSEEQFLPLAQKLYTAYLEKLVEEEKTDFDALLRRAADCIKQSDTRYATSYGNGDVKKLKYLFIDEYQDFSKGFSEFIRALRSQASDVKVFCVGDDWQAINGFAGSDLQYYKKFTDHFEHAVRLGISTNYRSTTSVVAVGNELMSGSGLTGRAVAHRKEAGQVFVADLGAFAPSEAERKDFPYDILPPALVRIIAHFYKLSVEQPMRAEDQGIVLLSRKTSISGGYGSSSNQGNARGIDKLLLRLKEVLPERMREHLFVDTAHKYKGKQKHTVIVVDAVARSYPLIHPYSRFTAILGDTLEETIAEERRLFYVALTRAVENLVIITDSTEGQESPFLEEIAGSLSCLKLDLNSLLPLVPSVVVKIENCESSIDTRQIKDMLKVENYRFDKDAKHPVKSFWYKSFEPDLVLESLLEGSLWAQKADKVIVRSVDEQDQTIDAYRISKGKLSRLPS